MIVRLTYVVHFIICFIATVLVSACTHSRTLAVEELPLPDGYPNHSVGQISAHVDRTSSYLQSFEATASFRVESPEQSGSFSARIRERRGDSLFMAISPGLGIEAARALVTPDSLFLYDRINNRLIVGSVESASALLALPIQPETLFRSLLGILVPEDTTGWSVSSDEDNLYVLQDSSGYRTMSIDPRVWRVVSYREHDESGNVVEERTYSEFDRFGDTYLPRKVFFNRPVDQSTAQIFYRDLTLNPINLSFQLRVNPSATRQEFGY